MIEAHRRLRGNFPRPADDHRAAPSGRGAGRRRDRRRGRPDRRALRSRGELPDADDRHLYRRHAGRTRPDLSPGADRLHRRLAGRAMAGRTRSSRPSSAPPSCTGRMCGISPKSMPRSTPRTAPSRSTTRPSSRPRLGAWLIDADDARRAVADARAQRSTRWAARSSARCRARALSDAAPPAPAGAPCVSRRSGGASRACAPRLLAPCRGSLRRGRGAAHGAAGRGCRRAGRLRRQFHARRRRQDADRDRDGADARGGGRAAVFA